jgi:hypothetical protein
LPQTRSLLPSESRSTIKSTAREICAGYDVEQIDCKLRAESSNAATAAASVNWWVPPYQMVAYERAYPLERC